MADSGNDTSTPPPINLNYTVPSYILQPFVSWFESVNIRPLSTFDVNGSLKPYILGILIFPIVIAIIYLIWLFALILHSCIQNCCMKKERNVCGLPFFKLLRYQKYMYYMLILLAVGTVISFFITFIFSILVRTVDLSAVQDLNQLVDQGFETYDYLVSLDNSTYQLYSQILASPSACSGSPTPGQVQKFEAALNNLVSKMIGSSIPEYITKLNQVLVALNGAIGSVEYFFIVREALLISFATFQFLLAILYLFLLVRRKRTLKTPANRCCTCEFTIFLWQCFFAFLFAIVIHSLALVEADLCYPNVNENIIRIYTQALGYDSLAFSTNCTDPQNFDTYPESLQVICFYQTCERTNEFPFYNVTEKLDTVASATVVAMKELQIVGTPQCLTAVKNTITIVQNTADAVQWILYIISCPNINKLYSTVVFQHFCAVEVYYQINLTNAWFAGMLLLLLMETMYLYFEHIIFTPPEKFQRFTDIHPPTPKSEAKDSFSRFNFNPDLEVT